VIFATGMAKLSLSLRKYLIIKSYSVFNYALRHEDTEWGECEFHTPAALPPRKEPWYPLKHLPHPCTESEAKRKMGWKN